MVVRRVIRRSPFFKERDLNVTPAATAVAEKDVFVNLREGGSSDIEPVAPDDLARLMDINSAIVIHEAAADPHTGYQKESERAAANGYPSLNASTKVVQDPANATATPTAGKIPIADGSGTLNSWVTGATPSGSAGGDLTGTYPNPTVATSAITLAKMADMATASFLGRNTAGTGAPEVLSVATVKSLLNLTGTNSGDQTITLTGDVTGSGTASFAATIANNAVTLAKMATMATASFLGRNTAGTGNVEVLSVATVKTLLNLTGTNSGDQTITLTGDVTGSGTASFAATIANNAVTYAKMQNVSATDRLLGRSSAGAGVVQEITCTAAGRALIDDANATAQRTTLGLGTAATMTGPSGTIVGTTDTQTLTNKTLTTPTIGNFSNANHNHSSSSTGGTIAHSALTGLTTGDPHTQYVDGSGARNSSRVLLIGTADEIQLEVYAYDTGQTVPTVVFKDNAGNPLLQVDATGAVDIPNSLQLSGAPAVNTTSTQTLSNKTLDNSNEIQAAKGHRFWVHLSGSDLASGLTQILVPLGGIDSITYPHAMKRACKIVRASVVAMHADSTTPPATWILDIFKNGASASTFTFNLNASFFVDTVTHGAPSAASWAAGDTFGVKVRGTSLDALVVRIGLEFETTS